MNAPGSPSSPLQMTNFLVPCALCDGRPLQPGRVARSAAAPQARPRDLLDDADRRHRGQRVDEGEVAVGGDVLLDPLRVDPAAVLEDDLLLPREERRLEVALDPRHRLAAEGVDDGGGVLGGHPLVEDLLLLDGDEGAGRAEAHAADAADLAAVLLPLRLDRLLELLLDLVALEGEAARRDADVDLVRDGVPGLASRPGRSGRGLQC